MLLYGREFISELGMSHSHRFLHVLTFSAIARVPYEAQSCIKMVRGSILAATCCKEIKETLKLACCNWKGGGEVQAMQLERRKKDKLLRSTETHCRKTVLN